MARTEGKPKIFISCAWGNKSSVLGRQRQQVVEALCQKLESESWEVVRDKTGMRLGDLISTFIKSSQPRGSGHRRYNKQQIPPVTLLHRQNFTVFISGSEARRPIF